MKFSFKIKYKDMKIQVEIFARSYSNINSSNSMTNKLF